MWIIALFAKYINCILTRKKSEHTVEPSDWTKKRVSKIVHRLNFSTINIVNLPFTVDSFFSLSARFNIAFISTSCWSGEWRTLKGISSKLFQLRNAIFQICGEAVASGFTLWPPKSDKHLIYPCSITPESNTKVVSVKEMITNLKKAVDCYTNSLFQHLWKCIKNSTENMHTDVKM